MLLGRIKPSKIRSKKTSKQIKMKKLATDEINEPLLQQNLPYFLLSNAIFSQKQAKLITKKQTQSSIGKKIRIMNKTPKAPKNIVISTRFAPRRYPMYPIVSAFKGIKKIVFNDYYHVKIFFIL